MKNKLLIGLAWIAFVGVAAYAITGRADYALIGACAALIVLPPSYDPAIIIKDRQVRAGTHPESPDAWLSWYKPPLRDYTEWLAEAGDGEGYIYVRDRSRAHRFPTYDAAHKVTPKYDGSADIEYRAGVESAS